MKFWMQAAAAAALAGFATFGMAETMAEAKTMLTAAHPEVGECRIGREALNDPGLVRQIREGRRVREDTADKIRLWMRAYAAKARRQAKAAAKSDKARL